MRYVISDIHGCYDKLKKVLDSVNFNPDKDILYSVGDFCDRGPDNVKVVEYLMSLGDSFKAVFGNHDIWLWQFLNQDDTHWMDRDAWEVWDYNGGGITQQQFNKMPEDFCNKVRDWLGNLPYRIELDDFIIQHSHLRPVLERESYKDWTLKYVIDNDLCAKDYDNWFWYRDIIYFSRDIFGEYANTYMGDLINVPDKTMIIGHTSLLFKFTEKPIPMKDKEFNFIDIDTGSYIEKERYQCKCDGEITLLNLDTMEWVTSGNERGNFNE